MLGFAKVLSQIKLKDIVDLGFLPDSYVPLLFNQSVFRVLSEHLSCTCSQLSDNHLCWHYLIYEVPKCHL